MTGKVLALLASDIAANKQLVPVSLVPEQSPATGPPGAGNTCIEPGLMGPHLPDPNPVDAIFLDPQQVEAELLGPRLSGQLGMLLLPEAELEVAPRPYPDEASNEMQDDLSLVLPETAASFRSVLSSFLVAVFTLIIKLVLAPIAWLRGN